MSISKIGLSLIAVMALSTSAFAVEKLTAQVTEKEDVTCRPCGYDMEMGSTSEQAMHTVCDDCESQHVGDI